MCAEQFQTIIVSLQKLFGKLFEDDIKYLLSMDKLWEKRRRPTPLNWENMPEAGNNGVKD